MAEIDNIFESTSFSVLTPRAKQAVDTLYRRYINGDVALNGTLSNSSASVGPRILTRDLFNNRANLLVPTAYHVNLIDTINPVMFQYLTAEQKEELNQRLKHAFYFLSSQYQLDRVEKRWQVEKERSNQIYHCAALLDELNFWITNHGDADIAARDRLREDELKKKHAFYLSLTVPPKSIGLTGRKVGADLDAAEEWKRAGITRKAIGLMSFVNGPRLAWVWAHAFIRSVLAFLELEKFPGKANTIQALDGVSFFTGILSWSLYYARFLFNIWSVITHTFFPSEQEKLISRKERFFRQVDERKFALLNDGIWGPGNHLGFDTLVGDKPFFDAKVSMGYMGNVLMIALLIMDVSLTWLRQYEERKQHAKEETRYARDIRELREKLLVNPADLRLKEALNSVLASEAQYKVSWYYKETQTKYDLKYAMALLGSYTVMSGCFFTLETLGAIAGMSLGIVGALACFVFNTTYAAMTARLKIQKMEEIGFLAQTEHNKLLNDFPGLLTDDQRKQAYLKLKQLEASCNTQKELVTHEKRHFVRNVIIDAIVPIVVFSALMFVPTLPAAFAIILGVAALAFAVKKLLDHYQAKVEPAKLPGSIVQAEYNAAAVVAAPAAVARLGLFAKPSRLSEVEPFAVNMIPAVAAA